MAVTLKHVAELAGVSRSAVSRTFTEGASVSAKTKAKVLRAAKQLGYSPNLLARSLTTRQTRLIGLISNNFKNPIFLEIFDLFTKQIQEREYRPLIANLTPDYPPEAMLRMMQQYSVDAVIIASSTLPDGFAQMFQESGLPVVHAFGRVNGRAGVPTVGVDNQQCGRMAAEHLISLGYRDIAFLGGPASATTTIDRAAGFQEIVKGKKGVRASISYAQAYSFDAGREAMAEILKKRPAEAYFCGDDILSLGAISAIKDAGLSVPADIGILGFNDMTMANWAGIELSTIHQPLPEIITGSVDLAISNLEDPGRYPELRLFPCTIIDRNTLVAKAA